MGKPLQAAAASPQLCCAAPADGEMQACDLHSEQALERSMGARLLFSLQDFENQLFSYA